MATTPFDVTSFDDMRAAAAWARVQFDRYPSALKFQASHNSWSKLDTVTNVNTEPPRTVLPALMGGITAVSIPAVLQPPQKRKKEKQMGI